MIILGLNAFHADSSAALVRDGKLIAAAEEERFRRIKHWAGFPVQAIAYCLHEAGVQLSDVEHIAFNQDNRANLMRKIGYFLIQAPQYQFGAQPATQSPRPRGGSRFCWSKPSRAKPSARNSTAWSIIWRIYPRHSMSVLSIRRPLFRSMDSAISRARPGARQRDAKSQPMAEYIFRIRSASSIRR